MIYPFDQPVIWHVVFHPAPRWWARRFSHVSLAGAADGTWIHLDLHRQGVSVATVYRYDEVNDYLSFLLAHYTVVRFGAVEQMRSSFFRPMTCVSFVKHTLGIHSSALRPDALFKILLRDYDGVLLDEAQDPAGNTGTSATAD